jgi:hypothetical protein
MVVGTYFIVVGSYDDSVISVTFPESGKQTTAYALSMARGVLGIPNPIHAVVVASIDIVISDFFSSNSHMSEYMSDLSPNVPTWLHGRLQHLQLGGVGAGDGPGGGGGAGGGGTGGAGFFSKSTVKAVQPPPGPWCPAG